MSDTGKQSPLGANMMAGLLINEGLTLNPVTASYVGGSKVNANYTPGKLVNDTCLKWVTYAINDAYLRGYTSGANVSVDATTYGNLINMGQSRIPALANSKPPTYIANDPSGIWSGEATSGYGIAGDTGQGQDATWYPWNATWANRSVTQWGYIRLLALQAWNVFNWNGGDSSGANPNLSEPVYKEYVSSFMTADSFVNYSNQAIYSMRHGKEFLKGTYSNMSDLITADISGVSLSSQAFGQDLINLGKALNLPKINTFGLPSNLLQTIYENNAVTQTLNLALLGAGLQTDEIESITQGGANVTITKDQEQKIYGAFLIINGQALADILTPLSCKTPGLSTLADLLNVKKLFPISYTTLTVPIYNTEPGPTNSKTYYLLFVNQSMNPQLIAPKVVEQVAPVIVPGPPPIIEEPPPPAVLEEAIINKPPEVTVTQVIEAYIPKPPGEQVVPVVPLTLPATGGGGCVVLESYIPLAEEALHNGNLIRQAYQICEGHKIHLADEISLQTRPGTIIKAMNEYQPCIRITTDDGVSLVCSTTAPIPTLEKGVVKAPDLLGLSVGVYEQGVTRWRPVTEIEDVGMKFVRAIDTGNNSFWAGEVDGRYILHHNVIINDANEISKN